MSPSDVRAQQAREHHLAAEESNRQAAQHRAQRDCLVRQLRDSDPAYYVHRRLAAIVGCSEELIAHILRTTPTPTRRSRPRTSQ